MANKPRTKCITCKKKALFYDANGQCAKCAGLPSVTADEIRNNYRADRAIENPKLNPKLKFPQYTAAYMPQLIEDRKKAVLKILSTETEENRFTAITLAQRIGDMTGYSVGQLKVYEILASMGIETNSYRRVRK